MSAKLPTLLSAILLSAGLLAAALPGIARAQAAPPAGNLDDRVREQIRPPSEADREDAMLTGDTDLVLLRRTRLFSVTGGLSATGTDNAFLAPTGRKWDALFQANAGIRVGTRIAGKFDLFAAAGVSGVRYAENPSLDYSALTGAVGVAVSLKPIDIALTYQPSLVYSRDFGDRKITQHRLRADVSAPFAWKGFQIAPSVAVERALSKPKDYESWAYSAELGVSRPLSRKLPLLAYASLGYERRDYDNYFFDFLGVARKDDQFRASAGIVWRPNRWADIRASYSFSKNWSTSDVNRYRAHSGTIGISAAFRF